MTSFEKDKRDKLRRMIFLRIFNAIGMVAWRPDGYGGAKQYMRMIHPLNWIWLFVAIVYAVFMQGVPSTISDFRGMMRNEMVLW
jgi:hypothetical protein